MFRKAIWFLLLVLFLLGALVGGYYFYQYKTKQLIVELVGQFSPIADVRFNQINVDLEGKVELLGVKISPLGYNDNIHIDQIDIVTDDVWSLLSANTWFKSNLPQNLSLQLSSIIFNIDADFFGNNKFSSKKAVMQKTIWGLACAEEVSFVSLANSLGLTKLQIDSQIKLQAISSNRELRVAAALSAPGLVKGLYEFHLSSKVPLNFHDRIVLSQTEVVNGLFNITDVGFNIKRLKYCSKAENISESNYPDYYKAAVKLKMIGDKKTDLIELEQSVMTFFAPRSNVIMSLKPKDSLFLPEVFGQHFDFFKSKDLTLKVNKKEVSTRYLPLLKGHSIAVLKVDDEKDDALLAEIKEQAKQRKKIDNTPRYRSIPLAELDGLVGQEIRLKTLLGKELDGVLLKFEEERIVLRRRVDQGLVTYPIMKKNVDSVKVFR
ncbi:MAG: hypothetical protein ACI9ES_002496 [Oceanospirillaceae bacterium]|jgi:hypothetical protein